MSKTANSQETLEQIQSIFADALNLARNHEPVLALNTTYDGITMLNKTVRRTDKHLAGPLFLACGRAISRLSDEFQGGQAYQQRCVLSSAACNYLMLAREIFAGQDQGQEAEEALQAAYDCVFNVSHERKFPVPAMILAYISIDNFALPELLCDMEKAREVLLGRHAEVVARQDKLKLNAELSSNFLQQAVSLIQACEYLYEYREGVNLIWFQPNMALPKEIAEARAAVAFAQYNCDLIDLSDLTVANVNRSQRASQISTMILARVKALMAAVYVKFWRKSGSYSHYGVLAHQAMAYSQHCLDARWKSLVSVIGENCHEPLRRAQELELQTLCDCAGLSLSYATCFHQQMQYSHGQHGLDIAPHWYGLVGGSAADQGDITTMPVALEFATRYVMHDRLD